MDSLLPKQGSQKGKGMFYLIICTKPIVFKYFKVQYGTVIVITTYSWYEVYSYGPHFIPFLQFPLLRVFVVLLEKKLRAPVHKIV